MPCVLPSPRVFFFSPSQLCFFQVISHVNIVFTPYKDRPGPLPKHTPISLSTSCYIITDPWTNVVLLHFGPHKKRDICKRRNLQVLLLVSIEHSCRAWFFNWIGYVWSVNSYWTKKIGVLPERCKITKTKKTPKIGQIGMWWDNGQFYRENFTSGHQISEICIKSG